MILNYLKGTSAAVVSAVFAYLIMTIPFSEGDFNEYFTYLITYASVIGYIMGLPAIIILMTDKSEKIFTIKKISLFICLGIFVGLAVEMFMSFETVPFFFIASLIGALMFLIIQKVENKFMIFTIIVIHLLCIIIYPYLSVLTNL